MDNKLITGQIVTREGGSAARLGKPGFTLVSFTGIIAVPDEIVANQMPPEHQYTVYGRVEEGTDRLILFSHLIEKKDVSKISRGNDLSGLLTEPIWRI